MWANCSSFSPWISLLGILGRQKGLGVPCRGKELVQAPTLAGQLPQKQGCSKTSWTELGKQIGLRRKMHLSEAVKCSEQTFSRTGSQFKSLQGSSPETDESRWKFSMRHWHSRRVVGRFRAAGALKENQMGGLVRRPPGAQNSSSANASGGCHTKTKRRGSPIAVLSSYKPNYVSLGLNTIGSEAKNESAPNPACLFRCHYHRVAGSEPTRACLFFQC